MKLKLAGDLSGNAGRFNRPVDSGQEERRAYRNGEKEIEGGGG